MIETTHLRTLIAQAKISQALREMQAIAAQTGQSDLHDELTGLSARYQQNEKYNRSGILSGDEYRRTTNQLVAALLEVLNALSSPENVPEAPSGGNNTQIQGNQNIVIQDIKGSTVAVNVNAAPASPAAHSGPKRVFISYNHQEKDVALRVKKRLEQAGIAVILDLDDLQAGGDIKAFIEASIRASDATVSVVSGKSLRSGWVAMESINTFYAGTFTGKKFIAAYTEDSFFRRSFVDDSLDQIEAEIAEIEQTIANRLQKGRNIDDLQNELKRNKDLQHHLPAIVQRLKEALSVNIIGDAFEAGMEQIIEAISS